MPKSFSLLPDGYDAFLRHLKTRIRSAQVKAALAVNQELILLYWHIGRDILVRQQREGWGAKVIERLAQDLKREFSTMGDFFRTNLLYTPGQTHCRNTLNKCFYKVSSDSK
jgi:predicted nuclease of restriction endonuclease-like (RecB) superfamily